MGKERHRQSMRSGTTVMDTKLELLKEGMKRSYVEQCDYVVIFDADFQPEPDFLRRAIPYLLHNPEIALVQARWKFVNADECLMTRMQEISLDCHLTLVQEMGSATYAFFGFNGTAGVWRISALNEAGRWEDRTTVEDMDLSVRACLKGWKFVFISDIEVEEDYDVAYGKNYYFICLFLQSIAFIIVGFGYVGTFVP